MKKTPPHLPPKTKDLIMKDTYRSITTVVFFIVIAFITGIAATLTTIAWIAPFSVTDTTYTFRPRVLLEDAVQLDPVVEKQARQRMVRLYDSRQKVRNAFYGDAAYVGQAMMLTTEGWAVMYDPTYVRGEHQYWEAVDHQGMVFEVERSVLDSVSGLVYFKVKGEGFRADVSFPDWKEIDPKQPVYAVHAVGSAVAAFDDIVHEQRNVPYPLWQTPVTTKLAGELQGGDVLLSANGTFLGFANNEQVFVPSWLISTQLQPLFESGTNEYMVLPVSGYQISGMLVDDMFEELHGFYITQSSTRSSSTTLGVGDVIVGIAGEPYSPESAARHMLFAQELVPVNILRDGTRMNLLVAKKPL